MEQLNKAEAEFREVDLKSFQEKLQEAGWSTEYIYLDPKKNRYSVDVE